MSQPPSQPPASPLNPSSQEPPKRTGCPSCHAPIQGNEDQCAKCGLIFAKWRDPAKRAAEAKLAAFAAESSRGLPKWIYAMLLILIGGPLAIAFVPEVGIPVWGAKLRYALPVNWHARHRGSAQLTVSAGSQVLDQTELSMETSLVSSEYDTGHNSTLKQTFSHVMFTAVSAGRPPQEKSEAPNWNNGWVMSSRGDPISTMASVGNQMQSNAAAMKQHQQMKMNQETEYSYSPNLRTASAPPPKMDPYDKMFHDLSVSSLDLINFVTFFKWPKERVKVNGGWDQPFHTTLLSKFFATNITGSLPVKLEKGKRSASGYTTILTWDTPVTFSLSGNDNTANALFSQAPATGTYKGRAWINYEDGVVDRLEAELNANWTVPGRSESALTQVIGYPIDGGTPLQIKLTQNFKRL